MMRLSERDYSSYINASQIEKELQRMITNLLDSIGIFYRIWTRVKTYSSTYEKLTKKIPERGEDYKIQDLIGARIVCYFNEDISICEELLNKIFVEISKDRTIDELDPNTFKPTRRNYIYSLPNELTPNIDNSLWKYHFDKTFEIQIRTIFSEGWHEVEHDLRYKNQSCWDDSKELSRHLNGILATLETCDWSLSKVFYDLSYHNYKNNEWIDMLKNKLRIRIIDDTASEELQQILNKNENEIIKKFLTFDRKRLLHFLSESRIPITIDNIVYIVNHLFVKNAEIEQTIPQILHEKLLRFVEN